MAQGRAITAGPEAGGAQAKPGQAGRQVTGLGVATGPTGSYTRNTTMRARRTQPGSGRTWPFGEGGSDGGWRTCGLPVTIPGLVRLIPRRQNFGGTQHAHWRMSPQFFADHKLVAHAGRASSGTMASCTGPDEAAKPRTLAQLVRQQAEARRGRSHRLRQQEDGPGTVNGEATKAETKDGPGTVRGGTTKAETKEHLTLHLPHGQCHQTQHTQATGK